MLFVALRVLHVVAGAVWVGSVVWMNRFLMPATEALGPSGGQLMQHINQVLKLPRFMIRIAVVTVLTGLTLYGWDASASGGRWASSPSGIAFGLGGALAIVTMVVGLGVASPTAQKLGVLAAAVQSAGRAPTPEERAELTQLRTRLVQSSRVAMILLILAAAAMAGARYVV